MAALPRIVSSSDCLKCDVCCRFSGAASDMAPVFSPAEKKTVCAAGLTEDAFSGAGSPIGERAILTVDAEGARCPAFDRPSNGCRFYGDRPFDCRLYPLALMYDPQGTGVLLAADLACPVVEGLASTARLEQYVAEVARLLDTDAAGTVRECRGAIGEYKPWMEHATPLRDLSRALCRTDLGLRRLVPSAYRALASFCEADAPRLASHALPAIGVWSDLFDLYWRVERGRAIVIAAGNGPAFLIAPPMGTGPLEAAVETSADLLRELNGPDLPAQIQEVDDEQWPELERLGFVVSQEFTEYVYRRQDLASLAGRAYKGRRSARNRFARHHDAVFRAFREEDLPACVSLYRKWQRDRAEVDPSPLAIAQLEASASMFLCALRQADALGLRARVVEADGTIAACTAGYAVPGGEQFAVPIEIADRNARGAAAWCYWAFCREATGFPSINAMSDSGLPNLAAAKMADRPVRLVGSRVVRKG